MDQLHYDLLKILTFLIVAIALAVGYFIPVVDLDKYALGKKKDDSFPTPSALRLILIRSTAYFLILFFTIYCIQRANTLIGNYSPAMANTSSFTESFWTSLLQSMAGIAAITVSALLLLTQLISEKYSSVIIHLFRKTTTSYALLKMQIASIAFLTVTLVLSDTNEGVTQSPVLLSYSALVFSTVSVLSLPPFLISIIQQFRPRGLVDWAATLAEQQIKTLPKNNKNRTWLRWHTLVLVEALNSLKAIGASSVRENDDEITRRVIAKYISILNTYFEVISHEREFRERWDPKMSENLLYHYEGETDMVLSVSIEDAKFWLENNILNSVSHMIEEANTNKGEVLFITKDFYDQWSSLCKRKQKEVGLDVIAVIKMTIIDFYFIYRRLDIAKNEHLAAENQHFFIKALHQIMFSYFKKESAEEEKNLENTLKVVTGFLKSIALITTNANSEKLLQNWLLLIEATHERLVATLNKDSEVLKYVGPSFARVYLDLFVESLLTRNHRQSKIILQHITFTKDTTLFEDIFDQTNKRLSNIHARKNVGVENSIDASLVRSDKYTYNLIKSCLLVMVYRIYMQDEKLADKKIDGAFVVEKVSKFEQMELIRSNYLPHLKVELVSFIMNKLGVNGDNKNRIDKIVSDLLTPLDS